MNIKFNDEEITLRLSTYNNGFLKISATDSEGFPHMVVTRDPKMFPASNCADNELLIKDYAENEGILKVLQDAELISTTKRNVISGFITLQVVELKNESLWE